MLFLKGFSTLDCSAAPPTKVTYRPNNTTHGHRCMQENTTLETHRRLPSP